MKRKLTQLAFILIAFSMQKGYALSSGDVNIRLISGYFWLDNSCTAAGPQGKVVSFRVRNTKGSPLQGVRFTLGTIGFTATGGASYTSGTPSFLCRTPPSVYIGNIATGDSATVFFFVGYNCLIYPNNTNITTDYLTLPVSVTDVNAGIVTASFTKRIYVIRNASNNTITVLATTPNLIGTMLTISVAYTISNVKPGNIIDMELSTTSAFPAGYSIMGCKITSSSVTSDFPVNMKNTHNSDNIVSNMPSGGTVTIEWYLKITGAVTGITSSNIIPFVVSDAGSAQRWQANTTSFTGTSTPTNALVISKSVNYNHVYANDSVVYTITLRNSSSVANIAIDKLIDNLPRDYQFRYMETSTGVFPRLVTYSNSTTYPPYQDTNLLYFNGQKEISSGVFSWVVPKNDSIKLFYSAKVSAIPGLKDTNFITAYVGSSSVGTAFAVVNVYSALPLNILFFKVEKTSSGVDLFWGATNEDIFTKFSIYRQEEGIEGFTKIGEVMNPGNKDQIYYRFTDQNALSMNSNYFTYKLLQIDESGKQNAFFASIDLGKRIKDFSVVKVDRNYLGIGNINEGIKNIYITINDVNGKILYNGSIHRTDLLFLVPYNLLYDVGKCIFLTVEMASDRMSKKLIIE